MKNRWVATIQPIGRPLNSEGAYSLLPRSSYKAACVAARKEGARALQVFPIPAS
jgi:hypothetical protein